MLISSFGWNSATTGGILGQSQRAVLIGNEAVQLTKVSESLLDRKNGHEERYVQQQTRTQMAVPGRV